MNNGGSHDDFVRVEFDRPRILRFDTNAICDFEDVARRSIVDVVFGQERLTLGEVRLLLWAGFKHEDPRLSRSFVGTLLENHIVAGGTVQALADAVTEAVKRSRLYIALVGAVDPNSKGEASKASPTSASGSEAS